MSQHLLYGQMDKLAYLSSEYSLGFLPLWFLLTSLIFLIDLLLLMHSDSGTWVVIQAVLACCKLHMLYVTYGSHYNSTISCCMLQSTRGGIFISFLSLTWFYYYFRQHVLSTWVAALLTTVKYLWCNSCLYLYHSVTDMMSFLTLFDASYSVFHHLCIASSN